jgi:hypothetical protein
MEKVTLGSSGALSRAQFAIVQKVEAEGTPRAADNAILKEVERIRSRFATRRVSLVRG